MLTNEAINKAEAVGCGLPTRKILLFMKEASGTRKAAVINIPERNKSAYVR